MAHWLDPEPIDVPTSLRDVVGGHPLVAETLARRGILTVARARAFLDPTNYVPAPPNELPGMATASDRLRQAIQRGERIAVWGDFDADGQTATALLLESLGALGADVAFHIPTRQEGHGLHIPGLDQLIDKGAGLILTCDTGVTAHAAVSHANHRGAEIIITDHHVLSERLPPALAVVNPHRLPMEHPLYTLSGVGVAYQLIRTMDPTLADRTLDLVALGTVADVSTLIGDTRYLVQCGLAALRQTLRPGLQAVYQSAELRPEGITEEHIGFVLGPRLNALGRLAEAVDGVRLLTTTDPIRARSLATEVESLNARRQWLTKQVTNATLAQIERDPSLLNDHHAIVLSHPTWPGGVIGIVAGRLAERFNKPAVLIAAPPGEIARASGRSVPGVDLIASLSDCASLLEGYGGHPGAAGFSIQPERIPELRAALSRAVAGRAESVTEPALAIASYVELTDLTLGLVDELNRLSPFGRGNPPLNLAVRDLTILNKATLGRTGEHRRLTVQDPKDRIQTVFWWQGAGQPLPQGRFDLAITLRASDFRGMTEVQVEWVDARGQETTSVATTTEPTATVLDYRTASNQQALLREFVANGEIQVWADGPHSVEAQVSTRGQLVPGSRLVIWTLPPGPRELEDALERVQPEEVILFAHNPDLDEPSAFLRRLAGLVKFALQARQGQVDLDAVAAATAQRIDTVRVGLKWLAAQGQVSILRQGDETWHLTETSDPIDLQGIEAARARLDLLLAETAAYRTYFLSAPAEFLIR